MRARTIGRLLYTQWVVFLGGEKLLKTADQQNQIHHNRKCQSHPATTATAKFANELLCRSMRLQR